MMEKYPGIENTKLFGVLDSCLRNHVSSSMENEFTYPDGTKSWFYLKIEPVPEGILILSTDITHDKVAQLEISRLDRIYRVLSNINQAIIHIKEEQLLMDTASKIAVEEGQFKTASFAILDEISGELKIVSSSVNNEVPEDNSSNPLIFLYDHASKLYGQIII